MSLSTPHRPANGAASPLRLPGLLEGWVSSSRIFFLKPRGLLDDGWAGKTSRRTTPEEPGITK